MTYKLEKIPNEPITVYTMLEIDVNELAESDKALLDLLAKQDEMVYHIVNMHSLRLNLDELIRVAGHVAFGENAVFRKPLFKQKVRELVLITDDPSLSLAGEALHTDVYGNVPSRIFNSMEAALHYIRKQIAEF